MSQTVSVPLDAAAEGCSVGADPGETGTEGAVVAPPPQAASPTSAMSASGVNLVAFIFWNSSS
jgi:hypothetical protein